MLEKKGPHYTIEIATNDYPTTAAAVQGGAHRIELCSALPEGGLTPSYGLIRKCRQDFTVPIFPIIRPRGGDFLYTDAEFSVMLDDVGLCKGLGCDGVVIGLLQKDGSIDGRRTKKLVAAAYPMEVTFHRAFDRCADPFRALEEIIDAGCQRILTSGQQKTAPEGASLIRQLVEKGDGRITIMPGSGVRAENIKQLAGQTGAVEFHASLRSAAPTQMQFQHPHFADMMEEYTVHAIDASAVAALKSVLQ